MSHGYLKLFETPVIFNYLYEFNEIVFFFYEIDFMS